MRRLTFACGLLATLWSTLASAHKPSDSYLTINTQSDSAQISGQWDIAVRDLEFAVGVDTDGDSAITWGELRERRGVIEQYALAHLSFARVSTGATDPCPFAFNELLIDEHVDGAYAVLRFAGACAAAPAQLAIDYSLFFDVDPNHRGLLDLRTSLGHRAIVLSQDAPQFVAELGGRTQWRTQWSSTVKSFIGDGITHILQGYDHILFLITLLLPAVVLYRNARWEARTSLRDAMFDVAKVVTAFTLAHSFTLTVATLGWISLPSRFVEATIAFTVVLGALNNLYPLVTRRRWLAAFAFGLIHGFGFASVLSDLGLQNADLVLALFSFNVGVEVGQLAIVIVLVPIVYWLRTSLFYRRIFMPGGAVLIAALATWWFIERAFDVNAAFQLSRS